MRVFSGIVLGAVIASIAWSLFLSEYLKDLGRKAVIDIAGVQNPAVQIAACQDLHHMWTARYLSEDLDLFGNSNEPLSCGVLKNADSKFQTLSALATESPELTAELVKRYRALDRDSLCSLNDATLTVLN